MSRSAREQQALHSIEERLAGSDPKLASLLATFTRLTAGEAMPAREKTWVDCRQATRHQPHSRHHPRWDTVCRNARRMCHRLGWQRVGLLLWVVISIALVAVALLAGRGGSKGSCARSWATACTGQAPAHGAWSTTHRLAADRVLPEPPRISRPHPL